MAPKLNSVSGYLALLKDDDIELKQIALQHLNDSVQDFWHEIFDSIDEVEAMYEDKSFPSRKLAALVASKVYYFLGELQDAMTFALGAGDLFNLSEKGLYVTTIISKCIDAYIQYRTGQGQPSTQGLEDLVNRMFDRCISEKEFKQALGIALECRRIDRVKEAITSSGAVSTFLNYCVGLSLDLSPLEWRHEVLRTLVDLYAGLESPDYLSMCQCLVILDDPDSIAALFQKLLSSESGKPFVVYQLAFDLVDTASQKLCSSVRSTVMENLSIRSTNTTASVSAVQSTSTPAEVACEILTGTVSINMYLEFLYRNCKSDLVILRNAKVSFDPRNSILHSGLVFANAVMHFGTTRDAFLRGNLEWLSRASLWAKFSATAGLGVIHRGHIKEALNLLQPYLPQPGSSNRGSPYSAGGSLYALGLIHGSQGNVISNYLLNQLKMAENNEVIQHGACLGLGLATLATGRKDVYDALKTVMYTDTAVGGEGAGYGMGLTMLGHADPECIGELLAYAHETQHEKIIRSLAMALAFSVYGKEESADALIENLMKDKDPLLRYGGMYAIALAYAGTGNNVAVSRLLHVAVSDVSDDVRRAAVIAIGFILFRENNRNQCPRFVALLAESYNPHVRYGSCMALAVACAGTGMASALELLKPLQNDPVDFVRQGAVIAVAMILIQVSKAQDPRVEEFRNLLAERIVDKHETVMSKLGALMATGILDAGGRNVSITLTSRSGSKNMRSVIGLAMFMQYWYWYPLSYFLSLSLIPTAVIGLTSDLRMPVFKFKSSAKPSLFAYPSVVKPPEKKKGEKVKTAVLSFTKKTKAGAQKSSDEKPVKPMDVESVVSDKKEKETEPDFEILENPARVTIPQQKYISFDVDPRFKPVVSSPVFGIVVLEDTFAGSSKSEGSTVVQPIEYVTGLTHQKEEETKKQASEEDQDAPPFPPFTFDPALE